MPSNTSQELILAIPRQRFDQLGAFQGLSTNTRAYFPALLEPPHPLLIPRSQAEDDPSHKQIIPYTVLACHGRLLHYTRGASSGEARLRTLGSIGVGGHINSTDLAGQPPSPEAYHAALLRELHEELHLSSPFTLSLIAILNDDSNPVGQVHLGLVHLCQLQSPDIHPAEDALHNPQWLTLHQLRSQAATLETWSRLIIEHAHQLPLI